MVSKAVAIHDDKKCKVDFVVRRIKKKQKRNEMKIVRGSPRLLSFPIGGK